MYTSRRQLFKTAAGGLGASLLLNIAMAQTPTVTVKDYLSEVRIFAPGTPEFAKIVSTLGVDATLPTLPGASLFAAIRNDSSQAVELRILFQITKGEKTTSRDFEIGHTLAAGEATLVAPREVGGALASLLHAGKPGLATGFSGSSTVLPLDDYQGAAATVSIDSATLADGKFIGADTQNIYSRLVENDARQRSFFADLVAQSKTLPEAEIVQMLNARKDAAGAAKSKSTGIANFPLADQTEFGLSTGALAQLQHFGMATLASWAERENARLQSKPTLHR